MKKTILSQIAISLILLSCACLFKAGEVLAQETTAYDNARYGFHASWWKQFGQGAESDNGDGITVSSGSMELRAWGTTSWDTMGLGFWDGIDDTCSWFDRLDEKRVNENNKTFTLKGAKGNRFLWVKGLYSDEKVCFLSVSCAARDKEKYSLFAEDALGSFRLAGSRPDTGAAADAGSALLQVAVLKGVDSHGCNTFVLTAQKELDVSFCEAVPDEQYQMHPGRVLRKVHLKKGESCELTALIPEGMPRLVVVAQGREWVPAFSGEDGSLILAEGFSLARDSRHKAPQAKVHLPDSGM